MQTKCSTSVWNCYLLINFLLLSKKPLIYASTIITHSGLQKILGGSVLSRSVWLYVLAKCTEPFMLATCSVNVYKNDTHLFFGLVSFAAPRQKPAAVNPKEFTSIPSALNKHRHGQDSECPRLLLCVFL